MTAEKTPGMTSGQAAYEAAIAKAREQGSDSAFTPWHELEQWQRERHEAAAEAARSPLRREAATRLHDLREELRDASSQYDWLTCERDEARATLAATQADRDLLAASVEAVTAERDSAVTSLSAQRDLARDELTAVTAENERLSAGITELAGDLDDDRPERLPVSPRKLAAALRKLVTG